MSLVWKFQRRQLTKENIFIAKKLSNMLCYKRCFVVTYDNIVVSKTMTKKLPNVTSKWF